MCAEDREQTLSLGIVPALAVETGRKLSPGGQANTEGASLLKYEVRLARPLLVASERLPRYRALDSAPSNNVLERPGVVQINLRLLPVEAVGQPRPARAGRARFPAGARDSKLNDRSYLAACSFDSPGKDPVVWAASTRRLSRSARASQTRFSLGHRPPDQVVVLSKTPVIPDSVSVRHHQRQTEQWTEIDDLTAAGPEVPVPDRGFHPAARN